MHIIHNGKLAGRVYTGTAEGEGLVGPRPHHFFTPPPPHFCAEKKNN